MFQPRRHLPRYFVWRLEHGKRVPFWQPATRDRKRLGVRSERLPDDLAAAFGRCEALNRDLDRRRAGMAGPGGPAPHTVAWLIRLYRRSEDWARLRPRTQKDYQVHLAAIEADFGTAAVRAVTARVVAAYKRRLTPGRQGNYRLQVLSALFAFAKREGEIEGENPAARPRRFEVKPREQVWSDAQVARFLAAAPPELRSAMLLALYTGQRQADLLALRWSDVKDGWIELRQQKTGKRVSIPVARQLAAALDDAPKRGFFVLMAPGGAPWRPDHFRHAWRKATLKAGCDGLTFLDLRRTAVVWLAEAGCTVPQIAAITGHSIKDTQKILDTYWRPTRRQAEAAIRKLERR